MQAIFTTVLFAAPLIAAHPHIIRRQAPTPYHLQDDYTTSPEHFFSSAAWSYSTDPDPTHGAVEYLDADAAAAAGLLRYVAPTAGAHVNASTPGAGVYIGLGSPSSSASGSSGSTATNTEQQQQRASVRMLSTAVYNANTLIIADVAHIPSGCGTWPALWMLNTDLPWPAGGEFDIIENVNGAPQVAVTLHSAPGCAISSSSASPNTSLAATNEANSYTGTLQTPNCDIHAPTQSANAGCSILAPPNSASFGTPLNRNGGGIFAAEWTALGFRVWFFPRSSAANSALPPTLLTDTPDPTTFGAPIAAFAGDACDWTHRFHDMRLVIDTTLCGDWAGAQGVWGESCAASTGKATCAEWVASAGEQAFEEAYWEFDALRVYGK